MITKTAKKEIKQLLGHRYVEVIQGRLLKKGLLNNKKQIYSPSQITNVMNGVSHRIIEKIIWELVEEEKAIIKKREQLIQS
jgi:acid phosphatase family membrane protein YuiD